MSPTTRAWLFVRGPESVRIVISGASVDVYGPGSRTSHSRFSEAMDATLHQSAVEQSLVHDGFTLEQLTTERRSAERHAQSRDQLRLVPRRRLFD